MAGKFRYPNRIVDVARLWPEMITPKGRLVGRWEQMIALLERRDQALEDFLNTTGQGKDWSTVLVAASDSHRAGRATADFVCSGINDEKVLQRAIDSLPDIEISPGFTVKLGEVVMLEGTYSCAAGLNGRGGFIKFRMQGSKQSFAGGAWVFTAGSYVLFTNFFTVSLSGVLLSSLSVGSFSDGQIDLSDCRIQVSGGLSNSTNYVQDCSITGATTALITGPAFLTATHSTFQTDTVAVFLGNVGFELDDCRLSTTGGRSVDINFNNGLFAWQFNRMSGGSISGNILIQRTNALSSGTVVLNGVTISSPLLSSVPDQHLIEFVDLFSVIFTENTIVGFATTTPSLYDQLHIRSNGIGFTSRPNFSNNVFDAVGNQPFSAAGLTNNHRCNINIADAGVVDAIVGHNTTPDCVLDSGTDTETDPVPIGAAQDSLFWMTSGAVGGFNSGSVTTDETLAWMQVGGGIVGPAGAVGSVGPTGDSAQQDGLFWMFHQGLIGPKGDTGAIGLTVSHKRVTYTGGDISLTSTAIADVVAGGVLDIVLAAAVGDDIEFDISAFLGNQGQFTGFDVYTIVAGSPVNAFGPGLTASLATATGVPGWYHANEASFRPITGSIVRTLVAGDISGGTVTCRLRYAKTTATSRTLSANSVRPLYVWARNIGPATP